MKTINVIHLDGCGGCQLEMMTQQPQIVELFELVEFVTDDGDSQCDVGILLGGFTQEELDEVKSRHEHVLIGGACANTRYENLLEELAEASELGVYKERVYQVKGCPLSTPELLYTIHCLENGVAPKQKNYPVCKECKERENVCLLLEGRKCYGPITQAGCHAKCPSIGVACRGCRGYFPHANLELLEKIFVKNV